MLNTLQFYFLIALKCVQQGLPTSAYSVKLIVKLFPVQTMKAYVGMDV